MSISSRPAGLSRQHSRAYIHIPAYSAPSISLRTHPGKDLCSVIGASQHYDEHYETDRPPPAALDASTAVAHRLSKHAKPRDPINTGQPACRLARLPPAAASSFPCSSSAPERRRGGRPRPALVARRIDRRRVRTRRLPGGHVCAPAPGSAPAGPNPEADILALPTPRPRLIDKDARVFGSGHLLRKSTDHGAGKLSKTACSPAAAGWNPVCITLGRSSRHAARSGADLSGSHRRGSLVE